MSIASESETVWNEEAAPALLALDRVRHDLWLLEKRNAEEERLQDVQHQYAEIRGDIEARYHHVQQRRDVLHQQYDEPWSISEMRSIATEASQLLPLFQQLFANVRAGIKDIDDRKLQALLEEYLQSDTAQIRLYYDPRNAESEIGDQWNTAKRVFDEIPEEATADYAALCTFIDETLSAMSQLVYESSIDAEERRKMLYSLANSPSLANATTRLRQALEQQQVQYVVAQRSELNEMYRAIMKTSNSDEELSKAEDTWIMVAQISGLGAFDDDVEALRAARTIFNDMLYGGAFES